MNLYVVLVSLKIVLVSLRRDEENVVAFLQEWAMEGPILYF